MTLKIRTLPIVERWDCHGCGDCCWGSVIQLSDEDLKRIRRQRWNERPEYRGIRVVEARGWWRRRRQLARRRDGYCVFLTPERQCRIHQEYGGHEKPLVCRMYPFQFVATDNTAYLTLRRSCPSAAADRGRELARRVNDVRQLARQGNMLPEKRRPPTIVGAHRRSWQDTLRVADVLERLVRDDRYPTVRRLVHGLQFCRLLEMCRLRRLDGRRLASLLDMLEKSATQQPGDLFSDRRPPTRAADGMFRQTGFEYVRLLPGFVTETSWRERLRFARAAMAFARGKGRVPRIQPGSPETTFDALQRPLGHLGGEILEPLNRYFETAAASRQYALLGRRDWPLIDSFRALAMAFPVAMWILRIHCTERSPTVDDVVAVVGAVDRGQGYGPLCGRRHRYRVRGVARTGELERLVAWYAR